MNWNGRSVVFKWRGYVVELRKLFKETRFWWIGKKDLRIIGLRCW